jgi:glutathionyl-hydroquinone reductase
MRKDTITKALRCPYTEAEMVETAKKLAHEVGELQTVEEEKKASNSAFKERIDERTKEISQLASKYNKGYELRDVECDVRFNDPESGKKTIYRTDTAEAVETLGMTWEEKQDELQLNILPNDEPSEENIANTLENLDTTVQPEPPSTEDQSDGASA